MVRFLVALFVLAAAPIVAFGAMLGSGFAVAVAALEVGVVVAVIASGAVVVAVLVVRHDFVRGDVDSEASAPA
jgi:hypothetical protein